MATFGNTTGTTANNRNSSYYVYFSKKNLSENGSVSSISIYMQLSVTDNKFLYENDAVQPFDVSVAIYDTSTNYKTGTYATHHLTASEANKTAQWITIDLPSAVSLTAGDYLLGVVVRYDCEDDSSNHTTNGTTGTYFFASETGEYNYDYNVYDSVKDAIFDSMPSWTKQDYTTGGTNRNWCIYATYTAGSSSNIKTFGNTSIANVKSVNGVAKASIKSINGVTN